MQLLIARRIVREADAVGAPALAQQGGAQAKEHADGQLVGLATGHGGLANNFQADDHHFPRLFEQDGHGIVEQVPILQHDLQGIA
ncbi:hypothetical protein D3C72_1617850 [compost metagenome]